MSIRSPSGSMPGSRAKLPVLRRWGSFALVAPLLLFLLASFVVPVLMMLSRAVVDRDLERVWPDSAVALRQWDGAGLPPETLAATVAREIGAARRAGTLNQVANRLNYDIDRKSTRLNSSH